jgi:2-dehydro-3-deoxygalactonokinase
MQLISIDWGTSSFRASRWQIELADKSYSVVERLESNKGLLSIQAIFKSAPQKSSTEKSRYSTTFESYLFDTIGHWLDQPTTILMSGMVGSKTGWLEAPYISSPASLADVAAQLIEVPLSAQQLQPVRAFIVPGVSQTSPPDVMRGEETQIFGLGSDLLLEQPLNQQALFVLPGTHSKHVQFANAQIIGFKTFMTGELFGLLTQHSILAALCKLHNFDLASFEAGVLQAQNANDLTAQLFSLRAKYLVENDAGFCTASALSGLLIGNELKDVYRKTTVHLVGSDSLCDRYAKALELLGIKHLIEKEKSAELGALRIALEAKLI